MVLPPTPAPMMAMDFILLIEMQYVRVLLSHQIVILSYGAG